MDWENVPPINPRFFEELSMPVYVPTTSNGLLRKSSPERLGTKINLSASALGPADNRVFLPQCDFLPRHGCGYHAFCMVTPRRVGVGGLSEGQSFARPLSRHQLLTISFCHTFGPERFSYGRYVMFFF